MKKLLALFAAGLTAATVAFAASPVIGIHGYVGEGWGTTFSGVEQQPKKPFGINMYYGGGITCNFTLNGTIGIQPEINFYANNAGYNTTASGTYLGQTASYSITNKLSYYSIDIPVLLSLRVKKFDFVLGPYISIPVGEGTSTTTTVRTVNSSSSTSTSEGTFKIGNGVLFGLTTGMDYEMRVGGGRMFFGARYLLDFTPIKSEYTDGSGNKTYTDMFTRRALAVQVGYKFAL